MLTSEQYGIINEQLKQENASEFVSTLISCYANSVDRASELLSYIPKIAEKQLRIKQEKINQYSFATDLMLADRHLHPGKYKKADWPRFCMLFYTCKAHFSIGNADCRSIAGKAFFNEFIDMLKNKEEFDYMSKGDWCWVYSIDSDDADWLESVIRQNIDSEFQRPKESECLVMRR